MNNIRFILVFQLAMLCTLIKAQSLSVESFRLLENDLTANTYGTMEYDQNGQVSALIKVVTLETGFVFDGGMLGIVKTVQKAGEVWVYVPYGLQRITIAHPEFGVLRDYYFPVAIEKARTYEMKLNAIRSENGVSDVTTNVNVKFDNPMYTSEIYLNGIRLARGSWEGQIAATTYLIEVKEKGYRTYTTTITFDPTEQNRVITLPKLELITGTLYATSQPSGANVYLDGMYVGTTPLNKKGVTLGVHDVEFRLKGYNRYSTSISITDENVSTKLEPVLTEVKYLYKNSFYAGIGYQTFNINGLAANVGFYLHNLNVEAGYLMPSVTPATVYWVTSPESWSGNTTMMTCSYNPSGAIRGCIGYGIGGKFFRLTPQAGLSFYTIKGKEKSGNGNNDQTTYVVSGRGDVKIQYTPVRYIALTVISAYEMPVKMGSLASNLNEKTVYIKNWCSGMSVTAGIEIYF